MKKIIYTLFFSVLFFACEDNFDKNLLEGFPYYVEYDCRLHFDSHEVYKLYDYMGSFGIENYDSFDHTPIIFKLPPENISIKGIISSNIDWEFSGIPEWITISPSKGSPRIKEFEYGRWISFYDDTVIFSVARNVTPTVKSATVYLTGSDKGWIRVDTLHFTQHGITPEYTNSSTRQNLQ